MAVRIKTVTYPLQIGSHLLTGRFADRYQPFLVALTQRQQIARIQINLAQLETHQLRHPQAGGVEQLQHGQIANILPR